MSILFAILLFSFLIFIHEVGHFAAAKLSGVQVNEFALFMGPAIFKKQVGETLYSIRCIPVGGYCAMEGEDADTDNPRSFQKAAWWKRLIILVAGAAMNFIAGLILLAIVFGPKKQFAVPVVDSYEDGCALISEEGLHVGDRILEIDGERVYVANDFSTLLSLKPSQTHDLLVERDGSKVLLNDFVMEMREFPDGRGGKSLRYGFSFAITEATFGNRIQYVWNSAMNCARLVRLSLQMLLTGQMGLQDMGGPVMIVDQMNEVAAASKTTGDAVMNMVYFGAFIAINLAVMNLLPVPALDGGRVVGLLITSGVEAMIGRKLNPKYEGYLHGVGLVLLLALMALITFKDIFQVIRG